MSGPGVVKETFTEALHQGPPLCSENSVKFLGFPARWVVANKGEIDFMIAPSHECWTFGPSVAFTVTGGTGIYAGVSGSGTFSELARLGTTESGEVSTRRPGRSVCRVTTST